MNTSGYRDVGPAELAARIPGIRLVDVREPHELTGELGHIRGVESVPLATIAGAATAWPKDDEIVLVCRSGGRSAMAAATLSAMGFRRISNLVGGMLAWNEVGLPIER